MPELIAPEANYSRGRRWLACGRIEQACEAFCSVLDACPNALDDIAATFGGSANRQQAVATLRQEAESGTGLASPWALAARVAHDLGRLDEARRWSKRAVEANPMCASWWFELAENHLAANERPAAAAAYRRCLAIDPNHMPALSRLSVCKPRRWACVVRFLACWRLIHRLLRRLAWSGGRLHILEEKGNSAGAHQMRWAQALEHGSALSLFPLAPKGVEPEDFSEYAEHHPPFFWRWFLAREIEAEVHTVLDVGCGTGFTTEHFLHRGFDVTGVTCNPHEKSECLRRGIKVVEDDFHFLSVPDGRFDLVFSSHSLEHSISPLFALWEWKRVVRPGGYLLLVVPLPIEQDARTVSPDHYDPTTDSIDFARPGEKAPSLEEVRADHSAYGMGLHLFVLTYWQLRRLFRLSGLELVADAVEDPMAGEVVGVEHVNGRLPADHRRPLNGLFLLRKPASKQPPSAPIGNSCTKIGKKK